MQTKKYFTEARQPLKRMVGFFPFFDHNHSIPAVTGTRASSHALGALMVARFSHATVVAIFLSVTMKWHAMLLLAPG